MYRGGLELLSSGDGELLDDGPLTLGLIEEESALLGSVTLRLDKVEVDDGEVDDNHSDVDEVTGGGSEGKGKGTEAESRSAFKLECPPKLEVGQVLIVTRNTVRTHYFHAIASSATD